MNCFYIVNAEVILFPYEKTTRFRDNGWRRPLDNLLDYRVMILPVMLSYDFVDNIYFTAIVNFA